MATGFPYAECAESLLLSTDVQGVQGVSMSSSHKNSEDAATATPAISMSTASGSCATSPVQSESWYSAAESLCGDAGDGGDVGDGGDGGDGVDEAKLDITVCESLVPCLLQLSEVPQGLDLETTGLLVKAVDLLRRCGYAVEEISSVLAHASAYFVDIQDVCGHSSSMTSNEAGYILVVLLYIAHSYVLDETCRLQTWHEYLFQGYCRLETLDKAIMNLLGKLDFNLRLENDDLHYRHSKLLTLATQVTQRTQC